MANTKTRSKNSSSGSTRFWVPACASWRPAAALSAGSFDEAPSKVMVLTIGAGPAILGSCDQDPPSRQALLIRMSRRQMWRRLKPDWSNHPELSPHRDADDRTALGT